MDIIEKSATTCLNTIKIHYTWDIQNLRFSPSIDYTLESPVFSGGEKDEYNWQLIASVKSIYRSDIYLKLILKFVPGEKSAVVAKCQIDKLNSKNSNRGHIIDMEFREFNRAEPQKEFPGFSLSIHRPTATEDILEEDFCRIVCDITILENTNSTQEKCNLKLSELKEYVPMLEYVRDLFESPELCDITLLTCGPKIQAHKLILAARSSVFAAMFRHDMKEKQVNEVDISDMDYDVLVEMLRFMYTGKTCKLGKLADRLLAAADKYALDSLKNQCEKELRMTITVENAANLLILGDLYGAVALKSHVADFISAHAEEVMETTNYKSMHNTHPHLLDEVFQATAKKKIIQTSSTVENYQISWRDVNDAIRACNKMQEFTEELKKEIEDYKIINVIGL